MARDESEARQLLECLGVELGLQLVSALRIADPAGLEAILAQARTAPSRRPVPNPAPVTVHEPNPRRRRGKR